ncbi:MAG: DUF1565 domain-containing protein [Gammaproteobacteria bacterium]|nr:DUF1565 domain-containing protein [Gammaproteobacteria bacterium]
MKMISLFPLKRRAVTRHMLLLSLAVGFFGGAASATDYYLSPTGNDNNAGTQNQPWRTIARANSALQPGDTVYIQAGSYSGPIRPNRSGTSHGNRIIYRAFGDGDVNIAAPVSGSGINLDNRDYVSVIGRGTNDPPGTRRIRILPEPSGSNSLTQAAVFICGSEGAVVESVYARCENSNDCNDVAAFCLRWGPYNLNQYILFKDNDIQGEPRSSGNTVNQYTEDTLPLTTCRYCVIEDNFIGGSDHISLNVEFATVDNVVIRNNVIYNPDHTALSFYEDSPNDTLVENNVVRANGGNSNPQGSYTQWGNAFQFSADDHIVRYNTIIEANRPNCINQFDAGGLDAVSGSGGASPVIRNSRFYNNTIAKAYCAPVTLGSNGGSAPYVQGMSFANNIIYGNEDDLSYSMRYLWWSGPPSTNTDRWFGNMFGNPGGSPSQNVILWDQTSYTLDFVNANWSGGSRPDFSAFAGVSNVYSASPGFRDYNNNDFSLTAGSPAIDAGAPLTRVASADTGSGTSLRVEDSRWFFGNCANFPSWMGVTCEYIRVGPSFANSTEIQIAGANDGTNTITLATGISRSDGDYVWLSRDSDGTVLVQGSAPDIGAYEFASSGGDTIPPVPPPNVIIGQN